MVSGFLISPNDHDRMSSGLAIEILIWSNVGIGACVLNRLVISFIQSLHTGRGHRPVSSWQGPRAGPCEGGLHQASPDPLLCAEGAPSHPGRDRPGQISKRHSAAGGSCGCGSCFCGSPGAAIAGAFAVSSSTFKPSARISLTSTLKLSGTPASKLSS